MRCSIRGRGVGARAKSVVCTGECSGTYHVECAATKYAYDPSAEDCDMFRCDPCAMHRSSMTCRTPELSGDRSDPHNLSAVTLEDLMKQLKLITTTTDRRWEQIQGSLTDIQHNLAGVKWIIDVIRTDVSDISASHARICCGSGSPANHHLRSLCLVDLRRLLTLRRPSYREFSGLLGCRN